MDFTNIFIFYRPITKDKASFTLLLSSATQSTKIKEKLLHIKSDAFSICTNRPSLSTLILNNTQIKAKEGFIHQPILLLKE